MRLLIHPAIDEARLSQLQEAAPAIEIINANTSDEALEAMPSAAGFFGKLTPELLQAAERLQWAQSPTASLEHYLFPELIAHPCRLSNMRGLFSDVIADHVLGLMLSFARNLHLYRDQQRAGVWNPIGGEAARSSFTVGPGETSEVDRSHHRLADRSLGVVGLGGIGAELARRGAALGMSVCGVDPVAEAVSGVVDEVWRVDRLNELLAKCDYVVIAAPHTPQTERLFDRDRLQKMQPSAVLINVGRGVIVDLTALTEALEQGMIAGAALDVFDTEPLPDGHPLWSMRNVLITPHVAAASTRVPERHLEVLLENVRRFARGQEPLNLVDKTRWF